MNRSAKMAWAAVQALEEKKGREIRTLDISSISVLADYFIIAGAGNRNQAQAMSDNVEEILGRAGFEPKHIEGYRTASWILLDYRDIVVHVFSEEDREFYDLERIWRDGTVISPERLQILAEE